MRVSLFLLECQLVLSLCESCLGDHIVNFMGATIRLIQKTLSGSRCPSTLALTVFPCPLLQCSLNFRYRGYVVNGHPIDSCSLYLISYGFL